MKNVCVCVFHLKVCIHRNTAGGAQQVTRRVGRQWHKMAEALAIGDDQQAVDQLIQLPDVRAAMMKETVRDIQRECAALCRKDSTSLFKLKSPKDIKCFSAVEQEKELVKDAPTFLTMLNAAANNSKQLQQNKLKTAESVVHGTMSAAGVLLNCRSMHMNALQTLTALTLHEGGANNKTFDRLQRRFMSIGHKSLISLQDQLCEGFDSEVRKWQEDVVKESAAEAELVDILQKSPDNDEAESRLEKLTKTRHPGYMLVGDNVDVKVN